MFWVIIHDIHCCSWTGEGLHNVKLPDVMAGSSPGEKGGVRLCPRAIYLVIDVTVF
jgi:hypothetical protein